MDVALHARTLGQFVEWPNAIRFLQDDSAVMGACFQLKSRHDIQSNFIMARLLSRGF